MAETQISRQQIREGATKPAKLESWLNKLALGIKRKSKDKQHEDILTIAANNFEKEIEKGGAFKSVLSSVVSQALGVPWLDPFLQREIKKDATKGYDDFINKYMSTLGKGSKKYKSAQALKSQFKDIRNKVADATASSSFLMSQLAPLQFEKLEGLGLKEKFNQLDPTAKMKEDVFSELQMDIPGAHIDTEKKFLSNLFPSKESTPIPPTQAGRIGTRMVDDPTKGLKNILPTGVDLTKLEDYFGSKLGREEGIDLGVDKLGGNFNKVAPYINLLLQQYLKKGMF